MTGQPPPPAPPFADSDVELVARADYLSTWRQDAQDWDTLPEAHRAEYREDARVILWALWDAGRLLPPDLRYRDEDIWPIHESEATGR